MKRLSACPEKQPALQVDPGCSGLHSATGHEATGLCRFWAPEEEARIEERFCDENLSLLKTYCSAMDVDHIYHTYFTPREAKVTYSSMGRNRLDLSLSRDRTGIDCW
jgi:hypothetical protein